MPSVNSDLRRKRKYESGGALPPGHRTAQTLSLEVPQLLHEVAGLHESHVSKVEVAEDLVLKPPGSLLVWSSEVQSTTVTLQAFLVVVTVLIPAPMTVSQMGDLVMAIYIFYDSWTPLSDYEVQF